MKELERWKGVMQKMMTLTDEMVMVMAIYLLTLHISIVDPSTQRSGWSSLVVTQPSTGHQLLCVQCVSVCVCECTALSGIYYSGPSW